MGLHGLLQGWLFTVGFEVSTAVVMKSPIFWEVTRGWKNCIMGRGLICLMTGTSGGFLVASQEGLSSMKN
jgi:hypothetical protein